MPGHPGLFLTNADVLGLNMKDVDFGVLSHAHYDHADGIPEFFRVNSSAPFYFRENHRRKLLQRCLEL